MSVDSQQVFKFKVEASGDRLDRWLANQPQILSRSKAIQYIEMGNVRVNGKSTKPAYRVQTGDTVEVRVPRAISSELQSLQMDLDILFEDDDLIVINKPSGLVVHPALGHAQDTLVNALLAHFGKFDDSLKSDRPGIVHRLDKDTSGVLVVAKTESALLRLAEQFQKKSAHRVYWALVCGLPNKPSGTWHSHLARHPVHRKKFASTGTDKGKLAVTHYRVIKSAKSGFTWLECRLETGRTHQIRVHTSEAGTPVAGDPIYSRKRPHFPPRLALHATELGFKHPRTQEDLIFKTGWPTDLIGFVKGIGIEF